jgi:hypothetical protein
VPDEGVMIPGLTVLYRQSEGKQMLSFLKTALRPGSGSPTKDPEEFT